MTAPRPYRIDVSDEALEDLRRRLGETRWPEPIPGAGWDYGANIAYVRELCEYWRTEYDWRAQEGSLNRYPQFLCEVDGVDLHFWHVRGEGENRFPLLLVHGWPGSMFEFFELIGPLAADGYDVVVPALPGYGFGGKPRERGWGPLRIAHAFDKLMSRELGYGRYGVQGGDWGAVVANRLGAHCAERVAGIHVNLAGGPPPASATDEERRAYARFRAEESGYSAVQMTRPDSLTVAQSDSPAGLAAWILEKFRRWSDCDGDLERAFTKDALITNLMFYWAPNSVASSARIYYERREEDAGSTYRKVESPTAVAAFPKELFMSPREWVEPLYNIVRWTEMPRGGHFAALEEPDLLLDDVREFFATLR